MWKMLKKQLKKVSVQKWTLEKMYSFYFFGHNS